MCLPPVNARQKAYSWAGDTEACSHASSRSALTHFAICSEEINRKRSGYAGYSSGTYVKIDTRCVKHVDLLSVSTAIDKLIGSGAFCVNDIRELVGEQPIEEAWAKTHVLTRNYMPFDEALALGEGGT